MIRKIRLLIRKDKLLGKSSGYFSLLIWIIAGFAAKFSMIDQSYGYLIYFLWLNINFSPIHYLTLIVLAIILSLISYFLSLKILKDGEL